VFDQVRSDIFLPSGRQGAVREPLHPDTLEVPKHAHASGRRCAWVDGESSSGSHDPTVHSSPRRRAHRTGARHCHHQYRRRRRRRRRQVSRSIFLSLSFSLSLLVRTHRSCRFLTRSHVSSTLSCRADNGVTNVVIRPLSSCRHLLRRSRSDPRRPLYGPPPVLLLHLS